MNKIKLALGSRTFWTGVVTFIVNVVPAVRNLISPKWLPLVDSVLLLLTAYFHVNPSQNYNSN